MSYEKIDLMEYLPEYWQAIKEMKALQHILGDEVASLVTYNEDVVDQMFVETATWGLDRWEKVLGLAIDVHKSNQFRRERIKAKMRGKGTTTKQMIANVASAFSNGEVEVIECQEEYKFIIKFIGVKGIPDNMVDLSTTINEIKPAHLAYDFKFLYLLIKEIHEVRTLKEMQKIPLHHFAFNEGS